jgi:TPR repeat protein
MFATDSGTGRVSSSDNERYSINRDRVAAKLTPAQIVEAQRLVREFTDKYEGDGFDYEEAVRWWRKAAEQGNADAQVHLGDAYLYAKGLPQDSGEATRWFQSAIADGTVTDADAQYKLGEAYWFGNRIIKDTPKAAGWFTKAAEQGHAWAQYMLAVVYRRGDGLTQNYTEALRWYGKAAEQGNASAWRDLGEMYENGEGVPQDYVEAVKWYRRAAETQLPKFVGRPGVGTAGRDTRWVSCTTMGAASHRTSLRP